MSDTAPDLPTQVLVLRRLDEAALSTLLDRAEQLIGHPLLLDDDARRTLIAMADGDGRYLLDMAEPLQALPDTETPWTPPGSLEGRGFPEGELAIARAVVHPATAPKSMDVGEYRNARIPTLHPWNHPCHAPSPAASSRRGSAVSGRLRSRRV